MPAVVITIECFPGRRRPVVTTEGDEVGVAAVRPLVRLLGREPAWPGGGWLQLIIGRPEAIAAAWVHSGVAMSYDALAAAAGLRWPDPPHEARALRARFDWRGRVQQRIEGELWRRALERTLPRAGRARRRQRPWSLRPR